MVHLRIADSLLDRLDNLEQTEFIVGNIAPDSGIPNADWSVFTPNTTVSHFKAADKNGKMVISVDNYVNQHFTRELRSNYDKKQYSFYLGYYVHLLTDILWQKEIVEASIVADWAAYEADRNAAIWKWKEDWYDLDFLYLRDNPDFHAFQIYEQAEGFQNKYLDIFAEDAFDNRRKYITEFYHEKKDNLDREYPYLSKEKMDVFVERAVHFIEEEIIKNEMIYA